MNLAAQMRLTPEPNGGTAADASSGPPAPESQRPLNRPSTPTRPWHQERTTQTHRSLSVGGGLWVKRPTSRS